MYTLTHTYIYINITEGTKCSIPYHLVFFKKGTWCVNGKVNKLNFTPRLRYFGFPHNSHLSNSTQTHTLYIDTQHRNHIHIHSYIIQDQKNFYIYISMYTTMCNFLYYTTNIFGRKRSNWLVLHKKLHHIENITTIT